MNKVLFRHISSILAALMLMVFGSQLVEAVSTDAVSEFQAGVRPRAEFPDETGTPNGLSYLSEADDTLPALDNLYVTHVPTFSFGKHELTKESIEYPAQMEQRPHPSGAANIYVPHILGVADLSGKKDGSWKVTVNQEKPFRVKGTNDYLFYSRIRLYGNTVTNSDVKTDDITNSQATGIKKSDTTNYTQIPVKDPMLPKNDSEGELEILRGVSREFTNKSYTSSVFENSYRRMQYVRNTASVPPVYNDVKLFVSDKDARLAKKYEADLVWTITAEP